MKILFISSGNSKYGTSPIIKSQGNSLIEQGVDLDFFMIKGKGPFGYLKNIIPLRKTLKKNNYDILHAHYGYCGIVALLAKYNEKVIISYMGSDLLFKGDYNFIYKFNSIIEINLNRFFARHFYDYIILKSDEMSGKLPAVNRKTTIPNGINLDIFKPETKEEARKILNLNHETKIILFSSDPSRPEKNFMLAKKALELIKDDHFVLIFLKGIEHKKLKYYYNSADVLLLTSFHEGSPNVIKEAMACNCPIVSTDVGDIRYIVGLTNGCFITSFDPHDVAAKIRESLNFKGRTNGRQRIIDLNLDSKNVALHLKSIYSSVIN